MSKAEPWRDRARYSASPKPCLGCGKKESSYWGPWCYDCNVERMERIGGQLNAIEERLSPPGRCTGCGREWGRPMTAGSSRQVHVSCGACAA